MIQKQKRVSSYTLMRTAQKMRNKPMCWVEVPTENKAASNVGTDQRAGKMPAFLPVEAFEFKSRQGVVYGRYLPQEHRKQENNQ